MKQGFTMVEILVSLTVFSILMAGTMSFFVYGINFANYGIGKLDINRDIRTFTNQMSAHAISANDFAIYTSFSSRTEVSDGFSGDFLLLINHDPSDSSKISKLTGYYRDATDATSGPVYSFTEEFSPSSSSSFVDLIPASATNGTHSEVVELSRGLSDGKLFYNFYDRSIMIKGEFENPGSLTEDATNTYNYTVSPRG
tara:strand:+ start:1254 stop:1847 length:594 start_codon:yes stop_codon:yes gene_type:complete